MGEGKEGEGREGGGRGEREGMYVLSDTRLALYLALDS